jgi:diguanylate cyclase (GGDEF)-like protein
MTLKIENQHNEISSQFILNDEEHEELYRLIFESNADAIFISDKSGLVRLINRKAEQLLNLPYEQIVGHNMQLFSNVTDSREINVVRPGKDVGIAEIRSTEIKLKSSQPLYVANVRDVTELVRFREEMRALAFVDEMVGLCNRRGFFVLAEQQLKLASRTRKGLYLLLIQIDNFQQVTDTYGQRSGNKLMIRFAKLLKDTFRNSDIITRISEDTFAVLTLEAESGSDDVMAKRLLHRLETYNTKNSPDSENLMAIMGASYYNPGDSTSVNELLQNADLQLDRHRQGNRKSALLWYLEQDTHIHKN